MPSRPKDPLAKAVKRLAPLIAKVSSGSFANEGPFRCALRSSIVKAFEFAAVTHKKGMPPYFLAPTLRGICEELIVLSFLAPISSRDALIECLSIDGVFQGLKGQESFFKETRPWQPVVRYTQSPHDKVHADLLALAGAEGWTLRKHATLPTVRWMAESRGLLPLYDLIYAATSRYVHFTPHFLMRMAWTELDKTQKHDVPLSTEYTFSTSHFHQYHAAFNRTYSAYMLTLMLRRFADEFPDKQKLERRTDAVEHALNEQLRWPELVTHEELNLDPPHFMLRVMARAAFKLENT